MFEFKYFDKIISDQKAQNSLEPALDPHFHLSDLGTEGRFTYLLAPLKRGLLLSALAFFRQFWPNPRVGRAILVSRHEDVREVLEANAELISPYNLEMTELAGGEPFVLGMEGPEHDAQNALIRKVMTPQDASTVLDLTRYFAEKLLEGSGGKIDVVQDLITRVGTETCCRYFGLKVETPDEFAEWAMSISALLFADPFGNATTRQLALKGARLIRQTIDHSIAAAEARPGGLPDTVLGRLLAEKSNDASLTDAKIRAILVGLITGFIPTNTLAAGKVFEELLRRPNVLTQAIKAAQSGNRDELQAIIMEAARLNPALAPGQWRYAEKEFVIAAGSWRSRRVKAKDVIMVSTMSALRDRRAFRSPGTFNAEREESNDIMFGLGTHWCLGKHAAVAQITEIFNVLLAQPSLKLAKGKAGRMQWVGPFPRRLDMEFEPKAAPASQSMILVCAPVTDKTPIEELQTQIRAMGNPATGTVAAALEATGLIHFASLSAVDAGDSETPQPYLMLEVNADGDEVAAIRALADKAETWLAPIFAHTGHVANRSFADHLIAHRVALRARPWGPTGLHFNGTPEFAVGDIEVQAKLADFVREALDYYYKHYKGFGNRAYKALDFVRQLIYADPALGLHASADPQWTSLKARGPSFAGFLFRPSRRRLLISDWDERSQSDALWSFATSPTGRGIGLGLLALIAIVGAAIHFAIGPVAQGHLVGRIMFELVGAIGASALILAAAIGLALGYLRKLEKADVPDEREAKIERIKAITECEDAPGHVQNHIIALMPLKKGWYRKVTLAAALWGIGQLVVNSYRPGFVVDMGTIHYAKWFRLAGSKQFVFMSNYDGSWESYLEDFIMKAHQGQTAAWSNGEGFPRTRFLMLDGAEDGDRFKRWVRCQQIPTQFWYSRFPALTTNQIRTNAMIHDGLMRATTDTAARAWIDCIGSAPRQNYTIESDEVQTMVFRGFRDFSYMNCATIELPDDVAKAKEWLNGVLRGQSVDPDAPSVSVTFGDHPIQVKNKTGAAFLALSARGLARLGLTGGDSGGNLDTFPSAFKIGMANRGRILGDLDTPASDWLWSDQNDTTVGEPNTDAALFVYAGTEDALAGLHGEHITYLMSKGGRLVHSLGTQPVVVPNPDPNAHPLDYEHFQFRDGISQPVIRGTQRFSKGASPRDIVGTGEFILGYRNNLGIVPPDLTVDTASDPRDHLPDPAASKPSRFPDFGADDPACPVRDFGRNGTFLVIRQLAQDVDGFEKFIEDQSNAINDNLNLQSIIGSKASKDWVAAKLMGRWRDGTPLIDRPMPSSSITAAPKARPSNDFSYGIDDPMGQKCPFGSHIRRTNPRDSLIPEDPNQQDITNRHRLLRRGRPYEYKPAGQSTSEKGMLFVCLCADIERQFEFIQQTWVQASTFHGLTNEPDPIISSTSATPDARFTIPLSSGNLTLSPMQKFVTVKAGGYFFLPSRSALKYLAERA